MKATKEHYCIVLGTMYRETGQVVPFEISRMSLAEIITEIGDLLKKHDCVPFTFKDMRKIVRAIDMK